MGSLSIWHWIIVVVVVLLLFGRGKISELMGDMAQGIKAFKKGMSEDDTAKAEPKPGEPMKTINAGDIKQQAETQKKFEGTV
ncbi:twin-arginine translocase TatA/TatE family subunit [Pseudorhodoplanes sp.]|uniref:twin-arginine translocase TatA/TatE family subunit n=1 Tax=Pseudorhodoplanes sp. TaxID=1934341 RepID=UPI002D070C3B|nr:twin-arginine translocase TatA/TatE family subunit [Pseudorhodoplanes sp.]HWV54848.1 twin-arginine translocase TatA/TatE family subunit [Pseudorhodoplanes sp.]